MSMINRAKLEASFQSFSTAFDKALAEAPAKGLEVCSQFPSDAPVETYNWLGSVPAMTKWVGDRTIKKLRAEKYTIENFDWANGIEVHRDDFRDDKLGLVGKRIADLARQGQKAIDAEIARVLNNAFGAAGGTGYDGQFLIDTDHTASTEAGQASQSNSGGVAALDATSLDAGIKAMAAFKDENGDPLGIWPTHLVVGPSAWPAARDLVLKEYLAGGGSNPHHGLLKLVMLPRITANKWFLVDMSQGVGPLIVQTRQAPMLRDPNLGEQSMEFFMRKNFHYGADMTFGVGIGLWQTIYGSNAA